ncbi:MAG: pilus assembly protein PilP [Variovorax sp.]
MISKTLPLLALALAAGCSSKDADLDNFLATTKQEQPQGVEPLPEVKPQESFAYAARTLRSPFVPGGSGDSSAQSVRPNSSRSRQHLEQFSLDSLQMRGIMRIGGRQYALIRSPDGVVHRVQAGQYIGQSEGRITAVEPSRINLTEIVPDGLGGFMERPASLGLVE